MKIAKDYPKHIYCLEGDWNNDLRVKLSIKSTLVYLNDCFDIQNIHRHCATQEQFSHYLKEYKKRRYDKFSILYLVIPVLSI